MIQSVRALAVHGLFVEGALAAFRRARVPVAVTNTVPGPAARLDVAPLLAAVLEKRLGLNLQDRKDKCE